MTDDGRFLSRRERRAQEERDATSVPADTDALALGPISESIPTHAPDGRLLSRRERRRLERARQPMETWTAEEEMIATGQIPAMTPERIAEQEKLARERAAAAQQEAQEASAELQGLLGHPAVAQPEPEQGSSTPSVPSAVAYEYTPSVQSAPASEPTEPEPTPEWQAQEAPAPTSDHVPEWQPQTPQNQPPADDSAPPARTSLIAAVAADVAPVAPREPEPQPEPEDVPASSPSAPAPAPAWAETAHVPEETASPKFAPEPPGFEEPDAPSAAAGEPVAAMPAVQEPAAPRSAAEEPAAPTPTGAEPAAPAPAPVVPGMPPGMTPEMFAELFPPGSLQRRMMEDQAAADAAAAVEEEDPAAQIRRLAEEAVAGVDAASGWAPHEPSSPGAPDAQAPAEPASGYSFDPAPAPAVEQPAPDYYSQPSSPSASAIEQPAPETPDAAPAAFEVPTFALEDQPDHATPTPVSQDVAPAMEPSPGSPSAAGVDQAPFDAIIGDHPETAALDQVSAASAEFDAPRFGEVGVNPVVPADQAAPAPHGFSPAPQQSAPWADHPLSQVDREAPQLPEMPPVQGVPQPDLSSVGLRGAQQERGPVPIVEPVPTGQIEVPPRERPELTGADVPRHFKWAHLAVFGAVALLLGVVVWQVL